LVTERERHAGAQRGYFQREISTAGTGAADRLDADLAGTFADGARVEARDLGVAPPGRARLRQEPTAAGCQHDEQTNNNRADQNPADATHHGVENASVGVNASSTFARRAPPLAPPRAIWLQNCQSPLSGKDDAWQVETDPVA